MKKANGSEIDEAYVVSNQTADNSRRLATEAHPNPSIPELAEENVRGKEELFFKCPPWLMPPQLKQKQNSSHFRSVRVLQIKFKIC